MPSLFMPLAPPATAPAARFGPVLIGQLAGIFAVLGWGGYMALARAGMNQGLHAADFLVLRYGVAGVLTLPVLLTRGAALRRLGPWRAVALAAVAGPPFILFGVGGYHFAPLAHGAVIQPVTVTIVVTIVSAAFMGEALSRHRMAGVLIALAGVALVGFGAPGPVADAGAAWIGDLFFFVAGLLYAAFTLLMRRWRIDPLLGTTVISVLSAAAILPWFLTVDTMGRILALPPAALAMQLLVQGVISGVVAVLAFGITIRNLGAGPAGLFPSMVPVAATLIGIPLTGEFPTHVQAAGLLIATSGLLVAILPRRAG